MLFKCLKRPLSEHLSIVNMLKSLKGYLNIHGSVFVIFVTLKQSQLEKRDYLNAQKDAHQNTYGKSTS